MNLSAAYNQNVFTRASRTRAGFGQPQGIANVNSFFRWVKRNDPGFYNVVKKQAPHLLTIQGRAIGSNPPKQEFLGETPDIYSYEFGDGNLAATPSTGPGLKTAAVIAANEPPKTSWADSLIKLTNAVIPIWQQREVMKLQIKRAEQGLAPIDVSQLVTPGVRVEMSPEIQREIVATSKAGRTTIQLLLPVGIGLAALFFFMNKKRGR